MVSGEKSEVTISDCESPEGKQKYVHSWGGKSKMGNDSSKLTEILLNWNSNQQAMQAIYSAGLCHVSTLPENKVQMYDYAFCESYLNAYKKL